MPELQTNDTRAEAVETANAKSSRSLLPWIVVAAIVPISAGAGFGLGRLLASGKTQAIPEQQSATQDIGALLNKKATAEKGWYYDCDPVVANLNEPGASRYIRIVLTLELDAQLDQKKGKAYLDSKQPLIRNWLTIYFSSLTLADVQGQNNLNRIAAEIRDGLNQRLFPDAKPLICNVYYSEWAIQ
ncbi:MAG: flagellar basal body-associated FliL family protein [Sedimentisphaerales bacterium]|jgi:flagellar basal body-associated protein FliL|nr:flagellar basal body-associated FliL family protein [Sedimentisphaerales bacterium]